MFQFFKSKRMSERTVSDFYLLNAEDSTKIAASITFNLKDAGVCPEDHLFDHTRNSGCPKCGAVSWVPLTLMVLPVH